MREFSRPTLVVSNFFGFGHCRYNGDMISSPMVSKFKKYMSSLPDYVEVEIWIGDDL